MPFEFRLPIIVAIFSIVGFAFSLTPIYAQEDDPIASYIPAQIISLTDPIQQIATQAGTFTAERGVLIIGAILILVIFLIAGKIAGGVTRKVIEKWTTGKLAQRIQKTMRDSDVEPFEEDDEDAFTNPKNLIPKTVSYFFYVIGIVAAVNTLGLPEIAQAMSVIGLWIPKLVAAIIIVVLGSILVKFALAWIVGRKWFGKESEDYKTIATALKVIIYSMVIAIALTTIEIGEDVIPILVQAFAWGVAAAFAIAIGLGMKQFVPSWWLSRENKLMGIRIGNEIELQSDKGTIDRTGNTQFRIKLADGKYVIVPHKDMLDVHYMITEKSAKTDQK